MTVAIITKKRTGAAGVHAVTIDGLDTGLRIVKGEPPRFGEMQLWYLQVGDDAFSELGRYGSLNGALESVRGIYGALVGARAALKAAP